MLSVESPKKVLSRIFGTLRKVALRERIDAKDFIEEALNFGMNEIEAGKLALKRSSRDDIKYFAKRSLQGHMSINSDLTRIANQKKIKSVFDVGLVINARKIAFEKYHLQPFDELYIKNRIEVYEHMVSLLQQVSSSSDREIVSFAGGVLPLFFSYLSNAKELERRTIGVAIDP